MSFQSSNNLRRAILITLVAGVTGGCASTMEMGKGGSVVTGSAGETGSQGEAKQLVKCASPVATVALVEDQAGYGAMAQYGLPKSPLPLLRLMLAQTGCFRIVDRSAGLRATEGELALAQRGLVRQDQVVRAGQVTAARYALTPHVVFAESNAGGGAASLLGYLPIPGAGFIGAIAGSIRFKEAQVVIFLTDNRTTEQVGAAEGSATSTDMGIGGSALGRLGGAASGWANTNEGKVVAAAFLDAVNKLVPHVRSLK